MTKSQDQTPSSAPPRNGPLFLLGALAASALAAWILSRIIPLREAASALHLAKGGEGLWTLIGAGLFFPVVFGFLLVRKARGVDRKPLLAAYGGGIYLVGCAAESYVRGQLSLWPQLLAAGCACAALFVLLPKPRPKPDEDQDCDDPNDDDR